MPETELAVTLIFGGMMRPALKAGVQIEALVLCFFVGALAFVICSPGIGVLAGLTAYLVCYFLTRIDFDIFSILREASVMGICKNKSLYGCVYYEPW